MGDHISEEVWKPIAGFEGLYEVSNCGRVKSLERKVKRKDGAITPVREKILKNRLNASGYPVVLLRKGGEYFGKSVHRLVAIAFIPNPKNLEQVNHKDTDKTNNHVENLEWITGTENMRHAFRNGCFHTTERQRDCARSKQELTCIARRKCVAIYVPENDEILAIFRGTYDAERITGVSASKIVAVCKGKRNIAGGYHWKYLEE